ncbi:MAG: aldo/keto reductase [bacterium]|nr:aldo/keto reductase [bacterium]MCM1376756.1 aldo/keto reductase [Muribaculum sp.]
MAIWQFCTPDRAKDIRKGVGMQYRKDKYGNDISVLGYGCMRFTQTAGRIDMKKAEEEIMAAFRGGVNYYDTAYVYGGSEAALGEILERNGIREQVYVATKLPYYLIQNKASLDQYFEEQLRRLRTDYVDARVIIGLS